MQPILHLQHCISRQRTYAQINFYVVPLLWARPFLPNMLCHDGSRTPPSLPGEGRNPPLRAVTFAAWQTHDHVTGSGAG